MAFKPGVIEQGRKASAKATPKAADAFALQAHPEISWIQVSAEEEEPLSLNKIAARLNASGIPGASGRRGTWTGRSVKNVQDRVEALKKKAGKRLEEALKSESEEIARIHEELETALNWRGRTQEEMLHGLIHGFVCRSGLIFDNSIRQISGLMPLSLEEYCFIHYGLPHPLPAFRRYDDPAQERADWAKLRRARLLLRRKKDGTLKKARRWS